MNLNKNDLRKMLYEFNSWSNRLLQADYNDYLEVLIKYISFLDQTPIINDFIHECLTDDFNAEDEVNTVRSGYGRYVFSTGDTVKEEVCTVYSILKYIADKRIDINHSISRGYSYSNKYQDMLKGFNERFVMVLIRHIETFLTKTGIDMGLDDKQIYNITVQNGQAIFTGDNSTVTATNNTWVDIDKMSQLIDDINSKSVFLSESNKEIVDECLEAIESEAKSERPKKSIIKTALQTLSAIKDVTEFCAAVAALVQFFSAVF